MAALGCDHFGQYYNTADMVSGGVYAQVDQADVAPGQTGSIRIETSNPPRAGAKNLRLYETAGFPTVRLRRVFGAPKTAAGVGYRLWVPNLPSAEGFLGSPSYLSMVLFRFSDTANGTQVIAWLGTDGSVQLVRGDGLTPIDRSVPCVQPGAYNGLEAKFLEGSSAGAVEIRVNGVTRLNFTGNTLATANSEVSQISLIGPAFAAQVGFMDIADFHMWDTLTGDGPSDFAGNVGALRRRPIADTADADWALSSGGVGYSLLTDHSDATYVEADSTTLKSGWTCDAISAAGILYQQLSWRGLKTDAGDCDVAPSFKSSGSESPLTGQPMTTAETWRLGIVGIDPATAAPWTPSGMNASEACITRTL